MSVLDPLSRKHANSSAPAPSADGHAIGWTWQRHSLPRAVSATGSSAPRTLPPIISLVLLLALAFSACSGGRSLPAGVPNAAGPSHNSARTTGADHVNDPEIDRPARPLANAADGLAPVRLIIPKMGLDALILSLGPDTTGAMQAPRTGGPTDPVWSEVYWWNVGALPGQTGNAVIAGHVNRPDASPSTFTDLNRLIPGDQINVVTRSGRVLVFRVIAKDAPLVYVHGGNDPTIQRIFGPATTPNLNLMTCWGEWDGTQFNRRLVVYSKLDGPSPFPSNGGVPIG